MNSDNNNTNSQSNDGVRGTDPLGPTLFIRPHCSSFFSIVTHEDLRCRNVLPSTCFSATCSLKNCPAILSLYQIQHNEVSAYILHTYSIVLHCFFHSVHTPIVH